MNLEFNYSTKRANCKRCEFEVPIDDTELPSVIGCHVWYERDESKFIVRTIRAMDFWTTSDSKVLIRAVFTGDAVPVNGLYVRTRLRDSESLQAKLLAAIQADWETPTTEGTFQELKQEQQREGM